ncbi:hypothetical protein CDD83_1196 [Cordyceps sp. RAO-2017]|nr:hypothetical protein CDD83_1196 [Cordyceps sp. RAO-2017]
MSQQQITRRERKKANKSRTERNRQEDTEKARDEGGTGPCLVGDGRRAGAQQPAQTQHQSVERQRHEAAPRTSADAPSPPDQGGAQAGKQQSTAGVAQRLARPAHDTVAAAGGLPWAASHDSPMGHGVMAPTP